MTVANEIYMAHLQNYKQEDPKTRSQKYLIQPDDISFIGICHGYCSAARYD